MKSATSFRHLWLGLPRWLKSHGHHLFFAVCLLSLTSLLAWWTVFIHNAVHQEHQFLIEGLEYRGRMYAFLMGHDSEHPPQPGLYAQDPRMEIVRIADQQTPYRFPLRPYWPELAIQPSPVYLQSIDRKFQSRSFMVQGEGSLLGLLILVSSFMLYRLISVERRSARELREFWSRTTHEIKTPITGLKAFLQTLKTRDLERQELQPLVDMALEQVERQQPLAQNILLGKRLERDPRDLPREPIRLADFVGRFLDSHSSLLSRCRVDFDPSGATGVVASADPNSLHVILDNLTDNALKYGGDQPHIQIRLQSAEKEVAILFRDHGQGFDPRLAENLFEAYKRLSDELPEGKHGTGMGLYISRQLARKMGGELEAQSDGLGRGACFSLRLPCQRGSGR
jgi:signal transduction histidine kinase